MSKKLLIGAIAFVVAAGCGQEPIDRFRELEIVGDDIVASPRARNDASGPFSFRSVATSLAGSEEAASARVEGMFALLGPETSREIVCPWLREDPANGCDAACSSCAARRLDLSKAPLRLVGISNRIDLADHPDAASPAGEARLTFAVTRGPADDPSSAARRMTLIFEYAHPDTRAPRGWAEAWHRIGGLDGEPYAAALEALVREVTSARRLAQVRTNAAEGEPNEGMRELELDDAGAFRIRPLRNTPDPAFEGAPELDRFVTDNAHDIVHDTWLLPTAMRAQRVTARADVVRVGARVDDDVRRAFGAGTCNGCHGGVEKAIDGGFHLSPLRSGIAKVSPFLHDPSALGQDDLARREADLRARLAR